jgi:hypothetical protein
VVVRFAPPHCTCDVAKKPLPVNVSVSAPDAAFADAGKIEASVGAGFGVMVNETLEEVPPPGAGFTTVTAAVPVEARSVARIAAVNCVELTNVVVRFAPLHFTCDVEMNPLPSRVNVNAPELIAAADGWMPDRTGAGLAVIAKDNPAEVPPPGVALITVTVAVAAAATSVAVIAAVSCVALTYVVVRLLPFHSTCDAAMNPLPLTVSENAADPAAAVSGAIEAIAGAGLLTLNVAAAELPPPGVGVITVTDAVPAAAKSAAVIVAISCVDPM